MFNSSKIYKWQRIFEAKRNNNFDTRNIKQIYFRERQRDTRVDRWSEIKYERRKKNRMEEDGERREERVLS